MRSVVQNCVDCLNRTAFVVCGSPCTCNTNSPDYITAAQKAVEACLTEGHNVSVAIVARGGETKVLLRADGAGPHTVGSSIGKAFTSASMGRDTAGLAGFIGAKPENGGLRDMDARMVIQAGALPIRIGSALVGGISVGGVPSGAIDADCARAGLDAIGAE